MSELTRSRFPARVSILVALTLLIGVAATPAGDDWSTESAPAATLPDSPVEEHCAETVPVMGPTLNAPLVVDAELDASVRWVPSVTEAIVYQAPPCTWIW